MDLQITSSHPDEVNAEELAYALDQAGYFVRSITINSDAVWQQPTEQQQLAAAAVENGWTWLEAGGCICYHRGSDVIRIWFHSDGRIRRANLTNYPFEGGRLRQRIIDCFRDL